MKIPKTLKIGAHKFKVLQKTELEVVNGDLGSCQISTCRIWLNTTAGIAISQREQSFFHEIVEAINGLYNMKLEHQNIETLAEAMYQVLNDNGMLK